MHACNIVRAIGRALLFLCLGVAVDAQYGCDAIATQNVNVQTDFAADPATPPAISLPAISAFEVEGFTARHDLLQHDAGLFTPRHNL